MKKPVIGITLDFEEQGAYSNYPYYILRKNYADSVQANGGIPIFLPYDLSSTSYYINLIDGLIITGGYFDIDPKHYQVVEKHDLTKPKEVRTNFEINLLKSFLKTNKVLLGICGGMQLLNVVLGGSLYQDILTEVQGALNHEQKIAKHLPYHEINILENTNLAKIYDKKNATVNSTHHQAVKNLGDGLIASAISSADNIIEAIELADHRFCLGLEWHPEYLTNEIDQKIFASFVNAAKS